VRACLYRPGQRVSATTFVGAFAEQTLLHSAMVTEIPDAVDFASLRRSASPTARHITAAAIDRRRRTGRLGGRPCAAGGRGLAGRGSGGAMKARVLAAAVESGKARAMPAAWRGSDGRYDREDLKMRIRELHRRRSAGSARNPVGGPYG